uniref:DUF834 domain-containing protein n=1 Tax=Oryza brachyantha TaxID=4533 RepID=J3LSD5_ORYBR
HAHRLVKGARGEHVPVGAEGDAEGVVGVSGQRLHEAGLAAVAEVPDADGAVVGGEAMRRPSGEKARSDTPSPCPASSATGERSEVLQTRSSLSADA